MTNALISVLLLAASLSPLEAQSLNFRPNAAKIPQIISVHSSDVHAVLASSSRTLQEDIDASVETSKDLERRRMDTGDESVEAAHVPFVVCSLDEQILGGDRRSVRLGSPSA